jgi:glycogen synthase
VNILYVTSAVARYAKTGGLADVSAALPPYLRRAGHDVRVFLPYYSRVDDGGATLEVVLRELELRLGGHRYAAAIVRAERPGDAPVHLVHCPALYHRASIHNLDYQGVVRADLLADTGLSDAAHLFHEDPLREGRINFLLHGILYADGVSTVSPTYAAEIQTAAHGANLDPFLRARSSTVVGILNGVDYGEWSPEHDALIPARYSATSMAGKATNKAALLARLGLPHVPGVPVVGIVSRGRRWSPTAWPPTSRGTCRASCTRNCIAAWR